MIEAVSLKNSVILKFSKGNITHRVERKFEKEEWLVFTENGFIPDAAGVIPLGVSAQTFLDDKVQKDGLYQYREKDINNPEAKYEVSLWVRCGIAGPVGYTFGNYTPQEDTGWGDVLTPDDMRFTYLWGVDFRATNGQSYTDDQIRFHIESSIAEMERRLNITIIKKRIACDPDNRGLVQGVDYDEEEEYYKYRRERIQGVGMIHTRKRPVISISRLDLCVRHNVVRSLLDEYTLDKTKGKIEYFNRPMIGPNESIRALQNSLYRYGQDTVNAQRYYAIDYVAGYKSPADIPKDLRAAIGKMCAIEMLNIIGDGILAGFSSSSLSMDGVSESFSSTQSATSATYGARIMTYEKELNQYIQAVKMKFGNVVLGSL